MDEDEVLIPAKYIARASAGLSQITQAWAWVGCFTESDRSSPPLPACARQARLDRRSDSAFQEVQQ